jgi:hypothetical protein
MISSVIFTLCRLLQILLLLPMVGMLGYFMHPYVQANETAPTWLMLMFIVSVIAAAWCLLTLFQFHSSYIHSLFVLLVDVAFFACFIAGVVLMDFVKNWNCVSGSVPVGVQLGDHNYSGGNSWSFSVKKNCTMLKVSWVFGIINIILFFITAVFAWQLHHRAHDRTAAPVHKDRTVRRRRWV